MSHSASKDDDLWINQATDIDTEDGKILSNLRGRDVNKEEAYEELI